MFLSYIWRYISNYDRRLYILRKYIIPMYNTISMIMMLSCTMSIFIDASIFRNIDSAIIMIIVAIIMNR